MKKMPDVLFNKLCYILHRGFVEARLLATHRRGQARDLADAFEIIPGYLPNWNAASNSEPTRRQPSRSINSPRSAQAICYE